MNFWAREVCKFERAVGEVRPMGARSRRRGKSPGAAWGVGGFPAFEVGLPCGTACGTVRAVGFA